MNKIVLLIGGGLLVFVSIFLIWYFVPTVATDLNGDESTIKDTDPYDVVFDFYSDWLAYVHASGTPAANSALPGERFLTDAAKNALNEAILQTNTDVAIPVICQITAPDSVRAKIVHEVDDRAEIIVYPRYKTDNTSSSTNTTTVSGFSLVNLEKIDGSWRINSISCSRGDIAPESEYSFEQEGYLLKNVPAPLDSNFWHLVFAENGVEGHTAPLLFTASSTCTIRDAAPEICNPESLVEANRAVVKGEMNESGVTVVSMTVTTE